MFNALLITEQLDKTFTRAVVQRDLAALPANDTLIRVHYSSLNYKDALSASGNKGVTRNYPHTPGIDAAGVVESSSNPDLQPGDEVIVTSYDLGMNTAGGFGQYIRVPSAWVIKKPAGLSLRESMIYGTAGLTAGISVDILLAHGVAPSKGEVLVTGATGGVGCLSVMILAKLGFNVVAATGKLDQSDWLKSIGATSVVDRKAISDNSRPMLKERWAGVVDTVGGDMLSVAIKSTKAHGCVAACGNVASVELHTTVFPFILRGVVLAGSDSGMLPMPERTAIWGKMAADWKPANLESIVDEVDLHGLGPKIDAILQGQIRGRVVVTLD